MQAINFVVEINVSMLSHLPVYTRSVWFHLFRPHSNSPGDMWIFRRPNIPQGRPEWSHTWCTSASGSAELNCCNKRWRNWLEMPQFWQVKTLSVFTKVLFPQQKYPRQNAECTPCLAIEPHKVKTLVIYHLHRQTGQYTVWANAKQNSGLVNFVQASRLPFVPISSIYQKRPRKPEIGFKDGFQSFEKWNTNFLHLEK